MGKYFGTDGVRGVANETLTLDMAFNIGRFLGDYANKNYSGKIVIGKDTRLSSSMFENMLSAGIAASGCDAYQIGYCSTPCLAYVAQYDEFDLGIMISASHNPYYDNGIKCFSNDGIKFKDDILDKVEEYMDNPVGIPYKNHDEIGIIYEYPEGLKHYMEWIHNLYPNDLSNFKVLVDCANGSNSSIAYPVLLDLGCNVTAINYNPNGTNINNGCGSTHLESLKAEIVKGDYDIGFA
ncbi:MAG: phosphoglucosamine mutase, partial [Erysipelotrichaceae bacterium]|nr:phosphoglucosamine mutase [Erysipelotrichaceae bacterium]